jgi:putative heme iron utilization protein
MRNIQAARQLFLQESFGVLSTISVDLPGYPFGSVTPYCADEQCRPVIYISYIAQHTKNVLADSRVSLTVFDTTRDSTDAQAQGRVTLIGNACPIEGGETRIPERYFRYVPNARQYQATHDFAFFRLDLVRVRFIGGFGEIYWVEPGQFMTANPFSAAQESRIVDHMNNDHGEALKHYANGTDAKMVGIDAEGFDVLTAVRKLRIAFDNPVHNMEEARQALVAMARRS